MLQFMNEIECKLYTIVTCASLIKGRSGSIEMFHSVLIKLSYV